MFSSTSGSVAQELARWQKLARLQAEGRRDEMLALLDEMLAAKPQQGAPWHARGSLLLEMGRVQEAGESFTQAATWGGPGTEESALMLAACWRQCFRPEKALEVLEQALVQPEMSAQRTRQIEFAQVQAYLQAGQPDRALERLEHFLSQGGPDSPMVQLFRVEALARSGQLQQARQLLQSLPEQVADLRQALMSVLEREVMPGNPGLVDWASKAVAGVPLAYFEVLNHPVTIHAQRYLGPVIDLLEPKSGSKILVIQPDSRVPSLRLLTLTLARPAAVELMFTVPAESLTFCADQLAQRLEFKDEFQQGQLLPGASAPYVAYLLFPPATAASEFWILMRNHEPVTRFLALYPLYPDEADLVQQSGWESLIRRFESAGVSDVLDPSRPSSLA